MRTFFFTILMKDLRKSLSQDSNNSDWFSKQTKKYKIRKNSDSSIAVP